MATKYDEEEQLALKDDDGGAVISTIAVVAPTDMPGGYEFYADAGNGKSYKVRVPDGGVKAGERFEAIIVQPVGGTTGAGQPPNTGSRSHAIPTGRWRDGLCDCFAFGCCHPVFCLGFWCDFCLLGQILSRNKFNWIGSPAVTTTGKVDPCPYKFWSAMFVTILIAGLVGYGIFVYQVQQVVEGLEDVTIQSDQIIDLTDYTPAWASRINTICTILTSVLGLLVCVTTCRARGHLREKYNIEPSTCGGCEDCCCAYWCGPCTMCQMARHTADYQHYPAACCSVTGLDPQAPEVV